MCGSTTSFGESFTSSRSALTGSCLFVGFRCLGRLLLLLLSNSDDVDVQLPLRLLLLIGLTWRGRQRERQGKRGRTHYLGLRLGQETLLRGVGVLVGEQRGEKWERTVTGGAAELGAGLR